MNPMSQNMRFIVVLEAPPGIGPGDEGFADLCLTAWLWRRIPYTASIWKKRLYCSHPPLFTGAGYEVRTRYLHLGKVALYQMS